MKNNSPDILKKWLTAWSLSRELPLPIAYKSGFKVEVGDVKQKERYVFAELNEDFIELSNIINEPWIFLKTFASPEEIKGRVSEKWTFQPQGYFMVCSEPMVFPNRHLDTEYKFEFYDYNSTFVVKILTQNNEQVAIGHVVLVDDIAVYDRIITDINHRRKGLATTIIKELEKTVLAKGITKNVLVATEEGKQLYQSLGWEVHSLYISIVIVA
ncbi:MAG: GNAT family N-acetyltransferase [Flavobacterium sp. 38-13]|uniref:GNAT family N-acetyltransferase n=1 Tax=Flavobacterium sp. 38-13 TaxID=1896168 RepID=UPI000958ED2F|nr:GNAT family N-acetyltransferase [Flavobacterium sp. 38-13]OJX49460.1 MAG: GNAT family N-acetyltransferase [Flavobacterium sp. 38-13]